jgi:hypothetical protein
MPEKQDEELFSFFLICHVTRSAQFLFRIIGERNTKIIIYSTFNRSFLIRIHFKGHYSKAKNFTLFIKIPLNLYKQKEKRNNWLK